MKKNTLYIRCNTGMFFSGSSKNLIKVLGIGVLSVNFLMSCRTANQVDTLRVVPQKAAVMPDGSDQVKVDVAFHIPEKYMTRRSRLIIVPQLVSGDSVCQEYNPLVLDASIYRKKVQRMQVLDGYEDPYFKDAELIDNRKAFDIPYRVALNLPDGMADGEIRAVVTTDGCGECTGIDTLDIAEVKDPMSFFIPRMKTAGLKSEFVVRPKIREGKGVANLQFPINRYDIRMDMGNNEQEMNKMEEALKPILNDTLSVLDRLVITGLASADGSLALNTTLSRNRALSAKTWLTEKLGLPYKIQQLIAVESRPEGWQPVLEAMRQAGDKDSEAVAGILEKYADRNDDVQEYYIRRLPVWNRIKDRYLQKNRVVEYQYSYTVKSFTTDEQLLSLYEVRPDAFSEEELLHVAALVDTKEEREKVYQTTLKYYPDSEEALNNLALIYLEENRPAEACQILSAKKNPAEEVLINTLAVALYKNGMPDKAEVLLEKHASLAESRYNLGVMKAVSGDFEEAYRLLAPYADLNAAVLALRTGRMEEAGRILDLIQGNNYKEVEKLRKMLKR